MFTKPLLEAGPVSPGLLAILSYTWQPTCGGVADTNAHSQVKIGVGQEWHSSGLEDLSASKVSVLICCHIQLLKKGLEEN